LGNDFFEYDAKRLAFRGRRSGKSFSCGAMLFVRIREIDLVRQQARWEIVAKNTNKR
jgi:exoribonuclease R